MEMKMENGKWKIGREGREKAAGRARLRMKLWRVNNLLKINGKIYFERGKMDSILKKTVNGKKEG